VCLALLGAAGAGLTRYPAALLFPIVAIYLWGAAPRGQRWAVFAVVLVGATFTAGLGVWDNLTRFGGPLTTGYTLYAQAHDTARLLASPSAISRGFIQMTVSPCRGILVYFPLLLGILGARGRALRYGWFTLSTAAFAVAFMVVVSSFDDLTETGPIWVGGWGPRFLMPVLPALFLLAAIGSAAIRGRLLLPLILLGVTVNLPAVLLNDHRADREFRYLEANGLLGGPGAGTETWSIRGVPWLLQWEAVGRDFGLGGLQPPLTEEAHAIRAEVDSAPNLTTIPDAWWRYWLTYRHAPPNSPTRKKLRP